MAVQRSIFCVLLISAAVVSAERFKVEDCSNGTGIANVTHVVVSPDPISLSKNITASVDLFLNEDIPLNARFISKVYKVTSVFGYKLHIPGPCIRVAATCDSNHCDFLKGFREQICPFFPKGEKCDCPIKKGYFGGTKITIPVPQLGSIMKYFASGDFHIELKIFTKKNNSEKVLLCYVLTGTSTP